LENLQKKFNPNAPNTMKEIQNFQTKFNPNAPNTLSISIILVMKISLQDMSCKEDTRKFNIFSKKQGVELKRKSLAKKKNHALVLFHVWSQARI
jgi:hypothetical protein